MRSNTQRGLLPSSSMWQKRVDRDLRKEQVDLAHLLSQERTRILDTLQWNRTMWDSRLGHAHTTHHCIELTPGAKPVHSHPYRAGPRAREVEAAEVQRMLKAGVIEPSSAEWASTVVLVRKSDGSMRFCIDYRRLNALTLKESYPLPRMDDCIDSLGDATIFSTLDCNSGYWQIPVLPEDRDKTSFTSHEGFYRFTRMPFGLTNAPAPFQRMFHMELFSLSGRYHRLLSFVEAHVRHLDGVLERLYRAGLSLKLEKCHLCKDTVSYLGQVIRPGKLAVAEKNTLSFRTVQPHSTQSELRSFLGMCNLYRRFVSGFAKISSPLNALLRKSESPQLGPLKRSVGSFHNSQGETNKPTYSLAPKANIRSIPTHRRTRLAVVSSKGRAKSN
jgi:hypothetical protein